MREDLCSNGACGLLPSVSTDDVAEPKDARDAGTPAPVSRTSCRSAPPNAGVRAIEGERLGGADDDLTATAPVLEACGCGKRDANSAARVAREFATACSAGSFTGVSVNFED